MAQEGESDLFATTRGKLLLLLCRGPRTVNDLMAELNVTDNAVRAQLLNLQEAGLVRQVGLRPGTRKPHVEYELTPNARRLFPPAYEHVLHALVGVLRERLPADELAGLLSDVARRVLAKWVGELSSREPRSRLVELYDRISGQTPGVFFEDHADRLSLRACGCPLASVTATHPEVCAVLAEVLGDVLGATVRERCDRAGSPRCCFEVITVPGSTS
jgi:predicted ArsR family transcriptional regulator